MTPQAALDAQIEKYRAMTGEERLKLALDLHFRAQSRATASAINIPRRALMRWSGFCGRGSRWRKACDGAGACH
ncbi:MAG TPA: hypothetical protein VNY07_04750 [Chthoniobacterales bacterium]|nr:hypothetical protein [Chthoniobacterales bacterium]